MSRLVPLFSLSWRVYVLIIGVAAGLCSSLADYTMLQGWNTNNLPLMLEAQRLWPYTREVRERPAYHCHNVYTADGKLIVDVRGHPACISDAPLPVLSQAFVDDPYAIDLAVSLTNRITDPQQRALWIQYINSIQRYKGQ